MDRLSLPGVAAWVFETSASDVIYHKSQAFKLKLLPFLKDLQRKSKNGGTPLGHPKSQRGVMAIAFSVNGTVKSAKILFLAVCALSVATVAPARAADPEAYVRSIAERLEPLLQNGHITPESIDRFLKTNIFEELDMKRISAYVLRHHWLEISDQKQQKFMDIFRYLIIQNFKKQLVQYAKAEIRVIRSVEHQPEGVSVITRVRRPSKSSVNMNWRLFRDDNELKIFDVSVQGISKLAATRAEYKTVLEQHGFDHLISEICGRFEGAKPDSC